MNYSLGKSFGADARRKNKLLWTPNKSIITGRTDSRVGQRRLSPLWMRGVKGCFGCGEDHRDNTRHSLEAVTAAVEMMKLKHPKALLTIEYLVSIVLVASAESDEESSGSVRWMQDDNEED